MKHLYATLVTLLISNVLYAQTEQQNPNSAAGLFWRIKGNSGTVDGTNFIGTTDNVPFNIRVNNLRAGRIDNTNANAFFGLQAGNAVTSGQRNSFFGQRAGLSTTTGFDNTGIGNEALGSNTTGFFNTAVGGSTMFYNTTGSSNTAVGFFSMNDNVNGIQNTALGLSALQSNTAGSYNVGLGANALVSVTGNSNTAVGTLAGSTVGSGSRNSLFGDSADVALANLTNATAIGWNSHVAQSNSMVLGSIAGVNGATNTVSVGIGTTAPAQQLHVAGINASIRIGGLATGGGYNTSPATSPYNVIVADNVGDLYRLPNPGGSLNNYILTMNGAGSPAWSTSIPNAWGLTGNAGTTPATNFLGTTDNQIFVIRTNNIERARIDATNGNMAVGGTVTTVGKLSSYVPSTDNTGIGIYASMLGNSTGNTFGLFAENGSSTNLTKTGIAISVSGTGTGTHMGISSSTGMSAASTVPGYGIFNALGANGSGSHIGINNEVSEFGTGIPYGIFNSLNLTTTQTTPSYGILNFVDFSAGNRYGTWNDMQTSNTVTADSIFGTYNNFYGSGTDIQFGNYNSFTTTGTLGIKVGNYNFFGATGSTKYGVFNNFQKSIGTRYGMYNDFDDSTAAKFGVYNDFSGINASIHYGVYNNNINTSNSVKYGVVNAFSGTNGLVYGNYSSMFLGASYGSTAYGNYTTITNGSTSTGDAYGYLSSVSTGASGSGNSYGYYSAVNTGSGSSGTSYGVYSTVNDLGTGVKYAGYFNAVGNANYALYAQNATDLGWAGYFNGDLQARASTRICQLISDYSENLVRFGTCVTSSDWQNAATIAGLTVDYVADFDNGIASGTAVGLGSVEFVLDGIAETHINNTFSPTANIVYDLGTTTYSWDDVYADDFFNVSDIRAKEKVKDMPYGLAEIMKMKTISYELKDDPFHEPKIGLIAQDVLQLVPEAVKTHNYQITDEAKPSEFTKVELERMVMSYTSIVPVLVKGMQEQQQQIEELKKQNSLLLQLLEKK